MSKPFLWLGPARLPFLILTPACVLLGVACVHQDEAAGELIQRADAALYAAKQQGRNRAILAEQLSPSGTIRTTSRSGTSRGDRPAVVLK